MFLKKGLNKKGQMSDSVLKVIVDLIVLAFFTTVLYIYIIDSVNDSRFEKQFIARDVALLIDVIYAAPQELAVDYSSLNPVFPYSANPFARGTFELPGYTYDFMDPYRVDIYRETKETEEEAEESKNKGVFNFPDIVGRKTDYTKGTYHIAGDERIESMRTKIDVDLIEFEKRSHTLLIK